MTATIRGLALGLACLLLGACTVIHEVELDVDRLTYADAVGNSREGQALMNLVRIRYGEFPSFVDLTQLVTNYQTTDQVVVGAVWQPPPGRENNNGETKEHFSVLPTYTGAIIENPSLVYQPVQGPALVRKLFTPSKASVILALSRSGWAIDRLLATMVFSVNGRRNRLLTGGKIWEAEAEFLHFVQVMSLLQRKDALQIRFDAPSAKQAALRVEAVQAAMTAPTSSARLLAMSDLGPEPVKVRLCILQDRLDEVAVAEVERLRSELGLSRDVQCYRVTTSEEARADDQISLQMRSLYQLLETLALDIKVPEEHLENQSADRIDSVIDQLWYRDLAKIEVHSGRRAPTDALVSVKYGRHRYWIDGGDLASKETFNYLVLLLSITEAGGSGAQLVVSTN